MFPWTRQIFANYKLVLLLLVSMGVYANTFSNEFVFDDLMQISENETLTSWDYLPTYFTTHVWDFKFKEDWKGNYYRPLFVVWMRLNYWAFNVWPGGWHVTTILMHGLTTLLVFFLGRRVAGSATVAMWAALLFGVHPVHTEAVAWISGVTEPLVAVPFLGALLYHLRYRESGRRGDLVGAILCMAVAIFAKETAIVLPAIVGLYELALRADPLRQRLRTAIAAVVPFAAVAAIYMVARHYALGGFANSVTDVSAWEIVLTIPSIAMFYVRMLFVPVGMALFHEHPFIQDPASKAFLLPLLGCVILIGLMFYFFQRSRNTALILPIVVLPILPPLAAIGALGPNDLAHDRYLYIPSIGACILFAAALKWVSDRLELREWQPAVTIAAIAVVFSGMTMVQNTKWKNSYTLWEHATYVSPRNPKTWTQLAVAHLDDRRFREALPLLERARQIDPTLWRSNYVLGITYFELGEWNEAQKFLRIASEVEPTHNQVKNSYQYYCLGRAATRAGDYAAAEAALKKAIELRPKANGYHFALGYLMRELGRRGEARAAFQKELELNGNNPARMAIAELDKQVPGRIAN